MIAKIQFRENEKIYYYYTDKKRDLEKEILKATEELVKLKMEQAKYD